MDGPMSATTTAYLSSWQTRLFVSTQFCWALIAVLLVSTAWTLFAQLQQCITLPIHVPPWGGKPPFIRITNLKVGRSFGFADLSGLRGDDQEKLERRLNEHSPRYENKRWRIARIGESSIRQSRVTGPQAWVTTGIDE